MPSERMAHDRFLVCNDGPRMSFTNFVKNLSSLRNCTCTQSEHQLGPVGAGREELVPLARGGSALVKSRGAEEGGGESSRSRE